MWIHIYIYIYICVFAYICSYICLYVYFRFGLGILCMWSLCVVLAVVYVVQASVSIAILVCVYIFVYNLGFYFCFSLQVYMFVFLVHMYAGVFMVDMWLYSFSYSIVGVCTGSTQVTRQTRHSANSSCGCRVSRSAIVERENSMQESSAKISRPVKIYSVIMSK